MAAAAAGEEETSAFVSAPPPSSAPMSPKNRLKFLCSYGGEIIPCPSDGHHKYAGGNTRVLCVPRSVSFSELKQRIEEMIDCSPAAIKYELAVDGPDGPLVSIRCDADLAHMTDEYERLELAFPSSSGRFRLFLFSSPSPSSPSSPKNSAAVSSASTSLSSTIDGPAILGLNGHCIRNTPNLKGGKLTRQKSLGAAGATHHQPQKHILCRQLSAGALPYRSQAVPAGAFLCGSRMAPQPASRGRFHNGGGGACMLSSSGHHPSMSSSPLRSSPRKYVIW